MSERKKRKNGDGSWGKKKINGVEYITFSKTYDFLKFPKIFYGKTTTEVKEKQNKFESKPRHINKKDIPKMTLYEYAIDWLFNVKERELKDKSLDGHEECLEYYLKNYDLGKLQMCSINSIDIFEKHMDQLANKYARSTIVRTYAVIKQCLDYAVENKHIEENYARKAKIPSEDKVAVKEKEILILEEEDMEKVYQECFRVVDDDYKVNGKCKGEKIYGKNAYIVVLIMYTGMRVSECCGIKWKDIGEKFIHISKNRVLVKDRNNETGKKYKLVVNTTKTDKGDRDIPICDRAREMLEILKQFSDCNPESFVIGNQNRRNIARTLDSMLKRAECDTKHCGLHALRHSFATELFNQGLDMKTVAEILGHSNTEITMKIYIHIITRKKLEAIEIFNKKKVISNSDNIICLLKDNGIIISEIEPGVLGYIQDNRICKLSYIDNIPLEKDVIRGRDVYNEFYE